MAPKDNEDYESELTDLDDDDDYGAPKTKGKGKKAASSGGYKIKNVLTIPRATTYTAQALYEQIHNGDINLEPEYQRDVVWPEAKQVGIIDSIFRNFYIPPVIFAVNRDPSDQSLETMTCIDGKQRLTSIYRFMDGLIPHKDPITGDKLWFKDAGNTQNRRKTLLPDKYKRLFANKQVVCVEYHEISDHDEREIFQRVQLGMALTPAEKLQVIKSSRSDFIRELQQEFFSEDGGLSSDWLEWERSRGSDFRCLATVAFCLEKFKTLNHFSTLQQVEAWLNAPQSFSQSFCDKLQNTYAVFVQLIHDKAYSGAFSNPEKVAPVEFIAISLLIATHKDTFSLSQLSWAITELRKDLREQHKDIRLNNRVGKTGLTFVKELTVGKAKGEKGIPASEAVPLKESSGGGKRKRGSAESDDEEDEDDVSHKNKSVKVKKSPVKRTSSSVATKAEQKSLTPSAIVGAAASSSTAAKATLPPSAASGDRMAAIRAAKEKAKQNALSTTSSLPTPAPTASPTIPPPQTPLFTPSSSLMQAMTFKTDPTTPTIPSFSPAFPQVQVSPVTQPETSLEASLMANFNMIQGPPPGPNAVPPSPTTHNGYARDSQADRDRGGSSRFHDDRDHGRYGNPSGSSNGYRERVGGWRERDYGREDRDNAREKERDKYGESSSRRYSHDGPSDSGWGRR